MESPAFNLVRQILRSPNFLRQSLDQQQATLDQILTTGEITREELFRLINGERENKIISEQANNIVYNLESLDYNSFLNFVVKGNIKGKDVLALCNVSKKLNEYCDRSFQLLTNNGIAYGEPQNQYLFRILLNKGRIRIPPGKTPKQVYRDKFIGGRVLGFGSNYNGQLGLGDTKSRNLPTAISTLKNIIQVSAGLDHSLCLNMDGQVISFGASIQGQLGLGKMEYIVPPTIIPNLNNIIQIAAGSNHSLCLDQEGKVWGFGSNKSGLGLGVDDIFTPILIRDLNNIIEISTYDHHSLCLDDRGRVWVFGSDQWIGNELGLGDKPNKYGPAINPNLQNIIQTACGHNYSICLDDEGKVWSMGDNHLGQLGLNNYRAKNVPTKSDLLDKIIQVACGNFHTLGLDQDGRVWVFGDNRSGQLGLGKTSSREKVTLNPNLSNIIQVSCGNNHSLCLDNQGRVWIFGENSLRELGLPNQDTYITTPTIIPNLNRIIQITYGLFHGLCIQSSE